MTTFSKVTPDGRGGLVESKVRTIKQGDIARCPHYILVAAHYRPDGSCKCDDPDNKIMGEWGYKWNGKQWE